MWRVADGAAGAPLVAHTGSVYALAFTADSKRLASGGSDGTIRVWCAP
jgi:WD40 repeat protein